MADKAMKERHWERITNVTGHKFDIDSDSFSLRNIMEAPLLPNKEDIEVGPQYLSWSMGKYNSAPKESLYGVINFCLNSTKRQASWLRYR